MTPADRWMAFGILLSLVVTCTVIGYSMGAQTCAGLSFGFY
jgi:hypothetical protein